MTPALLGVRDWVMKNKGSPDETIGPDSSVSYKALPERLAKAIMKEIPTYNIHEYGYRGRTLKRAPKVAFKINKNVPYNHVILIKYSSPEMWAPPHHDKQEGVPGKGAHDIIADTSIVSITLCQPGDERTFTVEADNGSFKWSRKLEDRDVFVLGPETNKIATHSVPKEGREGQIRYSLIFRTVKLQDLDALMDKNATKTK